MLVQSDLSKAGMMKLLARLPVIAISVWLAALAALISSHSVNASLLYQWTTTDGTPTYSPQPPANGVAYTIVGADLQPVKGQEPLPTKGNGGVAMTPGAAGPSKKSTATSAKPATVWKPVKYADDPNPDAARPSFSSNSGSSSTAKPISLISDECIRVKQRLMLLEGQFANAQGAIQMDAAVLRLSAFRKETKGLCG